MSPERTFSSHHNEEDDKSKAFPFKKLSVSVIFCKDEHVRFIKIDHDSSSETNRVMCGICSKSLKSQAYHDRHMKTKHSNKAIVCNECGVSKNTLKQLSDHKRVHRQVICQKCGKMVTKVHKGRHFRTCKGNVAREEKVYKCQFCNYVSKTKSNTQRHETNNCHREESIIVF